ncbi:MAG TPA: HD-GYP domain-containing protein [Thermodesulfobacteriota bacterium]|nr:HD-GYP domain-containing protein [Thermodesulfobacteriota bacterium]
MSAIDGDSILKSVNAALKSRKLYPPGHPAISTPVKKSFELISSSLRTKESIVIGLVEEALVFEESPVADSERLYPEIREFMAGNNVETMVFARGLVESELVGLFELLASGNPGGLAKELKSKGISHIKLSTISKGKRNVLEVYNDAVEVVKGAMDEVRLGKIPRAEAVHNVVDEIADSVLSDPNAMAGLTMIKNYDNYLFNHSVNVSITSVSLARAMNLAEEDVHAVGVAAILHDIGKTGVSEKIIRKPGGLSSDEWEKIKEHPLLGSDIIKRMEGVLGLVERLVYEHHIKYDHSGYPATRENTHPYSQILTICDAYDALTTLRVYQKPHNPVEAIKIMTNFSGRYFEPEVLKTFTNMLGIYPVGTMVRLSTNEIGIVTKINSEAPESPTLKMVYDAEGSTVDTPFELDLAGDEGRDKTIVATVNPAAVNVDLSSFFEKESI